MCNIAETIMPTVLKLEKDRKDNNISDAGRKCYIWIKRMLQTFYLMLLTAKVMDAKAKAAKFGLKAKALTSLAVSLW